MELGLTGKNVLVTGGSKGIGREICRAFLAEGAQVSFCARNAEQIEAAVKELSALGTIHGTSLDVADGAALAAWVEEAARRSGGIDCVVSNASALSVGSSEENWRRGLEIDILGTQHLVAAAIPHLTKAAAEAKDASVVMISSTAALETAFANAYGATKAALIHLSKGLARQHAASGIRFNSVSPGTVYFEGGTWHTIEQKMPAIYKQTLARNPTGRMASPAEIANAVVFLSSPRSSFTTGANLVIDGALTQRVDY
jgi:3-oxoacyl-[acyl-carrier protein] reductase